MLLYKKTILYIFQGLWRCNSKNVSGKPTVKNRMGRFV